MINAVGRDIPEEILRLTGKEVFQGNNHFDGYEYRRQAPKVKCVIDPEKSKLRSRKLAKTSSRDLSETQQLII